MRIAHTCCCGASGVWEEPRGVYANPGGVRDAAGRMFQVEVQAHGWLDRHAHCKPSTLTPACSKAGAQEPVASQLAPTFPPEDASTMAAPRPETPA